MRSMIYGKGKKGAYRAVENTWADQRIKLSNNDCFIKVAEVFLRLKVCMLVFQRLDLFDFMNDDRPDLEVIDLFVFIIEVIL